MMRFWKKSRKENVETKPEEVEQGQPVEAVADVSQDEKELETPLSNNSPAEQKTSEQSSSWTERLTIGLSRSAQKLSTNIDSVFNKRKPDTDTLEDLEELLITADIGPQTAAKLVEQLKERRFTKDDASEVKTGLVEDITAILTPCAMPLGLSDTKPQVIVMVGANGTGKTTTIGKLAKRFQGDGKSVILAAGDTFRAAAIEQLQVWGQRNGCTVIAGDKNGDAAAVAYRALEAAKTENADIVLIDTAGRLHNKKNLMQELEKILRVISKAQEGAPHHILLTLDATTGQNAFHQVETFRDIVGVTGLIVTKLDGSARGGVVVGLADKFGLPIHAVGVGEGIEDLQPFDAAEFAKGLLGK